MEKCKDCIVAIIPLGRRLKRVTEVSYAEGDAFIVFNSEKLDYCPVCGKKINWAVVEESFLNKHPGRRRKREQS